MALDSHGRRFLPAILDPVGVALARLGVTANALTTAGMVITAAAAALLASGRVTAAGWLLLTGSLADTFDGPVARARGQVTTAGAFYDSVADRISDGLIFAALTWATRHDPLLFALSVSALVAAQVTSYVRAKAQSLGQSCAVGIFERAERSIALIVGLLFHRWLLEPVLWLLAGGSVLTVVQRMVHVLRRIDRTPHAPAPTTAGRSTPSRSSSRRTSPHEGPREELA